jgi:hypothetical protein
MEWESRYDENGPRNLLLFSLGYAVFAACVVIPPPAFTRAGFTVEALFSEGLGSERTQFIRYHLARTSLVLACHTLLPVLYLLMVFIYYSDLVPAWTVLGVDLATVAATTLLPVCLTILYTGISWYRDPSSRPFGVPHPLVKSLSAYTDVLTANNNNNILGWLETAMEIEREVAQESTEVFVRLGVTTVVTTSWLCVVGTYGVVVAHLRDVVLRVDTRLTVEREVPGVDGTEQVLGVEVTAGRAGRAGVASAVIRVSSADWDRLNDRLQGVILDARQVVVQQTLDQRFQAGLEEVVAANTAAYNDAQGQQGQAAARGINADPGDVCAGCMASAPEVRLVARCGRGSCESCFCRPLWCLKCLGRWFLAKQMERGTSTSAGWLTDGQAPCPTCRRTFCALDVVKV